MLPSMSPKAMILSSRLTAKDVIWF